MTTAPQPIDTAVRSDGWILGYDPRRAEQKFVPWLALTWDDAGWVDDEGCACEPTLWSPLPDPQPTPTGWRPPEGVIKVSEITGEGWTSNGNPVAVPWRWIISIERSDGSYDAYRDCDFRVTREEAEAVGAKWAEKYHLPVVVEQIPAPPSNVIPFFRGDAA